MRKGDKRLKYEDRKEIEKMKAANTADSLTMAAYNKKMEPKKSEYTEPQFTTS